LSNFTHRLGYQFKNPALLELALRHRSVGKPNNERLEFLGDAVLGFIISDLLFQQFPTASEGELSRLRAQLVQRSTLAVIARDLRLGDVIQLGLGELKSGGGDRESILADAMEALVSALYLDGGLAVCQQKLSEWLLARLPDFQRGALAKDPKTRLQELLQARKRPLPEYSVQSIAGSGHQQEFTVECKVALLSHSLIATGASRKEAEQVAAALALQQLEAARE
jgi:ribonuclease III